MPSAPRPARPRSTSAVVAGAVVACALAAALVWAVVRFASQNPDKVNLGSPVFNVGRAKRLARAVADGGPFLFQDPLSLGRGRNLYIQHLGGDPDAGWTAIEARLPGEPSCAVTWDRGKDRFVDCHGDDHPADGTGLTTYPGQVEGGQVRVDLRTAGR